MDKTLRQELKSAGNKRDFAGLTNVKNDTVQAYRFVRDVLGAAAMTLITGYAIDKALRTEHYKSPLQIAVVFSGCLILTLAYTAWLKIIRNYKTEG